MTGMTLLSCFSSCSTMYSSPSTTMVMRETVGSSVMPTAKESILKPRRENRPETLESVPGWFSTSTDMVYFIGVPTPSGYSEG